MSDVARLGGLVDAVALRLREAGLPAPRREAVRLVEDLERLAPGEALVRPERPVEGVRARAALRAAARRAAGEPLAYVTGQIGFRRLTLRTDARALIPRPETEGLVEHALRLAARGRVADVGTGTGCVALSLADEGAYELVVGVDRSAAALSLAAENVRATGRRARLVRGDLALPLRGGAFDVLVANPPYLSEAEHAALDPAVRDWEPAQALVAGADGLWHIERLLGQGLEAVRPGGGIALEIDAGRAEAAARCAARLGWTGVTIHEDLYGRARYLVARRSEGA